MFQVQRFRHVGFTLVVSGEACWQARSRIRETTAMTIEERRDEILRIAARYGARNVRVFGSVARNEDQADSDVDLLVEMEDDRSLLDLVGLQQDLEELLARNVDVLTDASIHPALRARIAADARAL